MPFSLVEFDAALAEPRRGQLDRIEHGLVDLSPARQRFHLMDCIMKTPWFVLASALVVLGSASASAQSNDEILKQRVAATERAFAKSMADRDFTAFASFVSDEAVFFSGTGPLRGKANVTAAWKRFFDQAQTAPFSWEPEVVEVLASGTLALSSGPVRNGAGKVTATFQSIWRLEPDGKWRIVFDKGNPACVTP